MSGVYDLRLVALSVLLAVFAAGTGLDLANSVTAAKGRARPAWLAGGALAMGTGFWSVHVVGALAFSMPGIPIAYDLSTLSTSVVLSIAASAVFLGVISRDRVGAPAGAVAVASLTAAIAGIHYLTMWGMRMPASIEWRRPLVLGSVVLALAASGLALWLSLLFRLDRRSSGAKLRLIGGVMLGAAVVLMHYTAMAAVRLTPVGRRMGVEESDVLATPGLAVAVAGAAMLILGIALTGSVVGRELARRKDLAQENAALYRAAQRELARRTEAELAERQTRLALEEALRVKTDFLAAMSHELRTPLNHIIGYGDLLLAGTPEPLPEPLHPSLERITGSARHLLHLIEEIFAYVRLERELDELRVAPVRVAALLREAIAAVDPPAREKELDVRAIPPPDDCELETDPGMIQQILVNLLENAVAFTPEGEIELRAECTPEAVEIHVRDTGVGIAAEHLDSIFEPFFQVEQGNTRSAEGTGMGLAVARRSAEVLGGEILVRSTPGQGSEFTLRVPRSPAPVQKRGGASARRPTEPPP